MANMTISDLRPAGSDLFADSENFLQELTEQEIGELLGIRGGDFTVVCSNGCTKEELYYQPNRRDDYFANGSEITNVANLNTGLNIQPIAYICAQY